jgi:hypothetical protein
MDEQYKSRLEYEIKTHEITIKQPIGKNTIKLMRHKGLYFFLEDKLYWPTGNVSRGGHNGK